MSKSRWWWLISAAIVLAPVIAVGWVAQRMFDHDAIEFACIMLAAPVGIYAAIRIENHRTETG